MLLAVLATGMFLFVGTRGQDPNCDFDPDLTYFDNEHLERLKTMFRIGGDCSSPIGWKVDGDQILAGYETRPVINNHKRSMNQDQSSQASSTHETKAKSQNLLPLRLFTPHTSRKSDNLETADENHGTYQIDRQPKFLRPNRHLKSQIQGPPEYFFSDENRRRRQNQDDFFTPDIETTLNQGRFEDILEYEDGFPPEKPRLPQSQRNSQKQNDNFGSDFQRRPFNQERPDRFFGQNNPRTPVTPNNAFDSQRPQTQRRPGGFFSPQNPGDPFLPGFQRQPQNQRRPDDFFPPQNQGNSFQPGFLGRRDNQRRPEDMFRPKNQRRPQNEGSQNDIFSDVPRRPFRPDTFRPDVQSNPQDNLDGVFIPGSQPDDQAFSSGMFPNTDRPLTTTRRPETTTLPGPPTWATPPSSCVRNCPNTPEYNPVCGSDRVTYRNPGRLRCEQRCGKASVNINHYGNCIATTAMPATTTTTSFSTTSTTTPRPSTTRPPFSRNFG
uniref:Kazal-like domain-containing protein n=1 Tax=Graphocephala atropunctata TaxID=36148 RepID=A0A1B6MC04_9HEMI